VWVGNFDGQPMRGVSGVTGAGPLLHRAMLVTARHYAPGDLPSPNAFGATRAVVCTLSGMRASAGCPHVAEWFLPGSAPQLYCDWHRDGVVVWPAEYVDWAAQNGASPPVPLSTRRRGGTVGEGAGQFQIVSPRADDRYEIPPGMDPRYATIALRAATMPGDGAVRWFVDGRRVLDSRWVLVTGTHVVRAVTTSGRSAETRFEVAGRQR
jgi:penicillin-binding protein 1C